MTGLDGGKRGTAPPPPPRPIEYRDVDASSWWVSLLTGIVLGAVGLWLLTNIFESVVILAWLVGASLIASGVVEVLTLGRRSALGWVAWLAGGISVLTGLVVLTWPEITLWALAVLAGLVLLTTGAFRVIMALANRRQPDWRLDLGLGVCSVVVGAVVLAWPGATLVVLAIVLGVRTVGTGFVAIGIGWQTRRLAT